MNTYIAEAGSNHQQELSIAKELIDMAVEARANIIKFQLFNAKYLYSDRKSEMYKIFKSIELNQKWIPELQNYSKKKKISFCSSFFDIKSLDVLKKNNLSHYKIASSELTNFNLLSRLSFIKKNIFVSTGMADLSDVINSIEFIKKITNSEITVMHCSANYPLDYKNVNLNVIKLYKSIFPKESIGFSDHTLDNVSSIAAVALGATVFEKHITLNKKFKGPDHFYALEPNEFKNYINDLNNASKCLGSESKTFLKSERKDSRREGIYLKKNISSGKSIKIQDLNLKSPPIGIDAKYINHILNLKINKDLSADSPLRWEDIGDDF